MQPTQLQAQIHWKSEITLNDQLAEHIGYFYIKTNKTDKITGRHFNSLFHSLAYMTVTVQEKVKNRDIYYRKDG